MRIDNNLIQSLKINRLVWNNSSPLHGWWAEEEQNPWLLCNSLIRLRIIHIVGKWNKFENVCNDPLAHVLDVRSSYVSWPPSQINNISPLVSLLQLLCTTPRVELNNSKEPLFSLFIGWQKCLSYIYFYLFLSPIIFLIYPDIFNMMWTKVSRKQDIDKRVDKELIPLLITFLHF